MQHVLNAQQFSKSDLFRLFKMADRFKKKVKRGKYRSLSRVLEGKHLISLFYEPSTRTRMSFEFAARFLGMHVTTTEDAEQFSSAIKGETLRDSVRVLCGYHPDAIVLRHKETGSAQIAADATCNGVSIFNAGDGKGQHPTQALLDLYTIYSEFGRLDNLTVLLGGDLANGRTGRSLCYLLSKFQNTRFIFLAPKSLQMKQDLLDHLDKHGVKWKFASDMDAAISEADVLYWTRVQLERMSAGDRKKLGGKSPYNLTIRTLPLLKKRAIIMHPLPRVDEISTDIDKDPRARYFEQASNGLFIRMALLHHVLKRKKKK